MFSLRSESEFSLITRKLPEHQADPNIVVRSAGFEAPALFIAIRNRNFEIVEALIEFGADVSARNSVFEGLEPELQERIKGFAEKYKRSEEKSLGNSQEKANCNNNTKGKPQLGWISLRKRSRSMSKLNKTRTISPLSSKSLEIRLNDQLFE